MNTVKAEAIEPGGVKDIKAMLASTGPCLSAYMALKNGTANQAAKTNALAWREALRSVEQRALQYGGEARELVESVSDWESIMNSGEPQGRSIAVFRSPDVFRVTWVDEEIKQRAILGPHFFIRPLLPDLTKSRSFYILALSKKNMRLLRCTTRTSEEVAFPPGTPASFDAYMNSAKPDHVSDNRGTPGPSSGSSKGIMFTTSSDREDKDEYLSHYFRQIDRAVNEVLRGKTEPVVPAGVEKEIALYRIMNTGAHLAQEAVQGAPNSLKSGEMHARAIEALDRCYEKKVDAALAEYNHKAGGGASNRLREILPAAHEGRVLTLLVSDSLETLGAFDENTYTVKGRETGTAEDEDLVNDAAVQCILHAGNVLVVPNGKMPNGVSVAGIFRF